MTNPEPLDWATTAPELALGPVYMCRLCLTVPGDFACDTEEGMEWRCAEHCILTPAEYAAGLGEADALFMLDHDSDLGAALEQAVDRELSEDAERVTSFLIEWKEGEDAENAEAWDRWEQDEPASPIVIAVNILTALACVAIAATWIFTLTHVALTLGPIVADLFRGLL